MPDPVEGQVPEDVSAEEVPPGDVVAIAIAAAIRRATEEALEAVRASASEASGPAVGPAGDNEAVALTEPDELDDELGPADGESAEDAGGPVLPAEWAIDAALGAAATAGRVASAVGRSGPAKVAASAARFLARPLSEEGHEVRERLGAEAAPAAREVLSTVTPNVVEAVDLNEVLASVDLDALLDRIDLDRLLDRIDLGRILDKVDIDGLISKVDVDALIGRVDIDGLISKVDVDALIGRVDIDGLISKVDIDGLLGRIDVDGIVARVDLQGLMAGLDLDEVLARLDLDAVLNRLDLDAVIGRIDIDQLVSNTEMGAIVARSTTGVASEALDVVRSQGVSLDNVASRIVARLLRRDPDALPLGPPLLVNDGPPALPPGSEAGNGAGRPSGAPQAEEATTS